MANRTLCRHQGVESNNPKDAPIDYYAYLNTLQIQPHVRAAMHQGGNIYKYNGRAI